MQAIELNRFLYRGLYHLGIGRPSKGGSHFHFVSDYEALVRSLVRRYPLEEAMSIAVGGGYETMGQILLDVLRESGLRDDMSLLDLGCGSGRLAAALSRSGLQIDYMGIDIVQKLLDYAATKSPPHYRFVLNRTLSIPAPAASMDVVCAFSVFTHLLPEETYLYLEDIRRVLKPDGRLVFSFLEMAAESHQKVFTETVDTTRIGAKPHLNTFIERSVIEIWAPKLGFRIEGYVEPDRRVGTAGKLGQSGAILRPV